MTVIGIIDWWGEVAIVLILCWIAYKAIAQRAGFQEPTWDEIKRLF